MQVLVLSLKEDQERRERIAQALNYFGVKFQIIDAIRGKNIDRENDPRVFNGKSCVVRHNFLSKTTLVGNLTDGELGCAMSHLKAYQYIVDSNEPGAVILEDDFVPECDLVSVFEKALRYCKDADIISGVGKKHEGIRHAFWHRLKKMPNSDYKIMRAGIPHLDWFFNRRRRQGLTCCYYISKDACEKLLKIGYPVRFESDVLTGMLAMNKLKYYFIQPHLGRTYGGSSIGVHGGAHFI